MRATHATSAARSSRMRATWSAMLSTCALTKQAAHGSALTAVKRFSIPVTWGGTWGHTQVINTSRKHKQQVLSETWFSKWFESRIISSLSSVIFRVSVVLKTGTVGDNLSGIHLQSQSDIVSSGWMIFVSGDWHIHHPISFTDDTVSLWLWRWLPLRLSKRQSLSQTVLFRTTLTRTITLHKLETRVLYNFYFVLNCCSSFIRRESLQVYTMFAGVRSFHRPSKTLT